MTRPVIRVQRRLLCVSFLLATLVAVVLGPAVSASAWSRAEAAPMWNTHGPPGAAIQSYAFSATTPGVVYAATTGGAFVTTNSGDRWTPIDEGFPRGCSVSQIAVDPTDPMKLYAAVTSISAQ